MEDISIDLAVAFTQFQKSPGRDDKWVDKVIGALERAWPEEHAKLGRLVNFSARLSDITKFRDPERAAATIGVFLQIVSSTELEDLQPSQPWIDYFNTNSGAFEPAFEVVRALRTNDADGWGGPSSSVARIAILFEAEGKSRRRGPLQLLHTLREEADTPIMERVVEALWTEEGQELCSQNSRSAHLSSSELSALVGESLKILKGAPARPRAATSNIGTTGPLSAPIRASTKRGASDLVASLASATSERKKALRASLLPEDDEGNLDAELPEAEPTAEQEALAALVTSIEGKKSRTKAPAASAAGPTDSPAVDQSPDPKPTEHDEPAPVAPDEDIWRDTSRRPTPMKKESPIMQQQTNGLDSAVPEKLQALRQRLERIERSAAEAQALLTELGPQLDEVYTWVSDLDAVLSRWSRSRAV
jgi:hypothetical protein